MDYGPVNPKPDSLEKIFRARAEASAREAQDRMERLLTAARQRVQENSRDPEAYLETSSCYRQLGEYEGALNALTEGLRHCEPSYKLCQSHIQLLQELNRAEDAIAAARKAALLFPDDFLLKLQIALTLPNLYDSREQLHHFRRRFENGLLELSAELRLDNPQARRNALDAAGQHTNVLLGYQVENDRALQIRYGEMLCRIMAATYPQWTAPIPMPPVAGPVRVGYLSSRFRDLSAAKLFLGWFEQHDPNRFEVYAYHTRIKTDAVTEQVRRAARHFRHIPDNLEELCRAVLADRLHILVFLDVGIDPLVTQAAALRLAPVQCMAWDQPVTSGLATMDYFLSSELMEPPDAHDHYSETLVRLPGIGVNYPKPVIPSLLLKKSRKDLGLRENAVVYLCSQTVTKYLPDHDDLFVRIVRRVPNSQFAFLVPNGPTARDLQLRLERVFAQAALCAADYCVLLPHTDRFTYWNRYLVSDIFLDTVGWSGGVSTLEAIACRLPVVTMPGRFLRGRHSYAILTQLGVTETIARDKEQYVEIAARLALDPSWRMSIIEAMVDRYPQLYGDQRPVTAWEDFIGNTISRAGGTSIG